MRRGLDRAKVVLVVVVTIVVVVPMVVMIVVVLTSNHFGKPIRIKRPLKASSIQTRFTAVLALSSGSSTMTLEEQKERLDSRIDQFKLLLLPSLIQKLKVLV